MIIHDNTMTQDPVSGSETPTKYLHLKIPYFWGFFKGLRAHSYH